MALNQLPDFSYKGEVPFASIVQAYQQKAQQEEQMRMNQAALKQQKINNVKDIFTQGAGLVDTLMKYSKQSQMQDAQNALTSLLGRGAEQVPTGQMTPASSSMVPQLNEASLTQDYSKTPGYKAELASLVTKAFPEEAGKEAAKAAFKQLNPESEKVGRGFQQSGIQIKDKDGVTRTVPVSYDTNTGTYLHPLTKQPITDTTQLQDLPDRGYAQVYTSAGFTSDGREVVREARSGNKFVIDDEGDYTPYSGQIFAKKENLPAGLTDSISELEYSQEVLGRIASTFDPEFAGPIAARANKVSAYVEALTEEQKVEFYGNVAEYKNSIIKAITGAQMSEVEAKRIIQQIPNENQSPTAFRAGLKRSWKATNERVQVKVRGAEKGGYAYRGNPMSAEKAEALLNEKLGLNASNSSSTPFNIDLDAVKAELKRRGL